MVFCIKKFLSYFCLIYSTNEGDLDLKYASLELPENKDAILRFMDKLHDVYNQELETIVARVSENKDFYVNFSYFTNAVLSRCINLLETKCYYNFIVVCIFIREIIFTSFKSVKCFSFAQVGLYCLLIIFNRFNERSLNDTDSYQELASYCKGFEEYAGPLAARTNISLLIKRQSDTDELNYELQSYEKERINECLYSIMVEEPFVKETSEALSDISSETDSDGSTVKYNYENDGISVKDSDESDGTSVNINDENPSIIDEVCFICKRKCLELVEDFLSSIKLKTPENDV